MDQESVHQEPDASSEQESTQDLAWLAAEPLQDDSAQPGTIAMVPTLLMAWMPDEQPSDTQPAEEPVMVAYALAEDSDGAEPEGEAGGQSDEATGADTKKYAATMDAKGYSYPEETTAADDSSGSDSEDSLSEGDFHEYTDKSADYGRDDSTYYYRGSGVDADDDSGIDYELRALPLAVAYTLEPEIIEPISSIDPVIYGPDDYVLTGDSSAGESVDDSLADGTAPNGAAADDTTDEAALYTITGSNDPLSGDTGEEATDGEDVTGDGASGNGDAEEEAVETVLLDTPPLLDLGQPSNGGPERRFNRITADEDPSTTDAHRAVATRERDLLTGMPDSPTTFQWEELRDSRLGGSGLAKRWDKVAGFNPELDVLDAPDSVTPGMIEALSGEIKKVSAKQIRRLVLQGDQFAPHEAAAFTCEGRDGLFIAFNDDTAGYQPRQDSLLYLKHLTFAPMTIEVI